MRPGVNIVWPPIGSDTPGPGDVYPTNVPGDFGYQEPRVGVSIETEPGSGEFEPADRIEWTEITRGMDGDDVVAKLVTHLDADDLTTAGEIGDRHFSQLLDQLKPDRLVRIAQGRGASPPEVLFEGYPLPVSLSWSDRSESLSVTCLDKGQELCGTGQRQQITARAMRWSPLSLWRPGPGERDDAPVHALPPVFNPGGKPNRSETAYPFLAGDADDPVTHQVHLFVDDGAPGAKHWRFVDAVRYIAFRYLLDVDGPSPISVVEFLDDTAGLVGLEESPDDPDPFVRRITAIVQDVSVQSMSAREALALLCDEARLHHEYTWRSAGTATDPEVEHFLRVFAILATEEEDAATPEREMIAPQSRDMPREAPFTDMAGRTAEDIARANAVVQSALTVDTRTINRPMHFGGYKEYEVTLLLRPGWLPHPQLDNLESTEDKAAALTYWNNQFAWPDINHYTLEPRSIYHLKHRLFHTVRHVARLWVFPDDGRYMTPGEPPTESPYARANWPARLYSPYDPGDPDNPGDPNRLVYAHPTLGAGIADAENWLPRMRPLRDTIGRRIESSVRAPVVWINFEASDPQTALAQPGWMPISAGAVVDEHRAAVTLKLDNLRFDASLMVNPGQVWDAHNYLEAFIYGLLQVAISGTIRGDSRMFHAPEPEGSTSSRHRWQVYDAGLDTFRFRDRSHNVFGDRFVPDDPDNSPEFSQRDDSERLERFAGEDADHKVQDTVSGSVELPWLDNTYRVGDSYTGIEGLGITFQTRPVIRRIQLVNVPGAGHRTVLHLTDLRHNPEVGAEAVA